MQTVLHEFVFEVNCSVHVPSLNYLQPMLRHEQGGTEESGIVQSRRLSVSMS